MDHYLTSGSQVIHILKTLACIVLQHIHLSLKKACGQLGIYWCGPLSANRKHLQYEKCQWQVLSKRCTMVSACI